MNTKFSSAFREDAVRKVLNRHSTTTIEEIASDLGVAKSSLYHWISLARKTSLEPGIKAQARERSPKDWSLEERLNFVIRCDSLNAEQVNAACREMGVYSHHLKQWKTDFLTGDTVTMNPEERAERKKLKQENQALKRELRRKEKALAEAAALLVLQKKVQELWDLDEDDSP